MNYDAVGLTQIWQYHNEKYILRNATKNVYLFCIDMSVYCQNYDNSVKSLLNI